MTRKFTTPAANWDGHCGRPSGPPPRRVITWSLYVPPTVRVTCKNGNLIAVRSLGLPGCITSLCRLRRRIARLAYLAVARFWGSQSAAKVIVRALCYLRAVLDFIDGESNHCWERVRRVDCCDLRCASEPQPTGAGRPPAWWAAFHDNARRKLSRFPRRNRWAGADSEHAQTGREIRCPVFIRGSDRFRPE